MTKATVIYGGKGKLLEAIKEAYAKYHPDLIVILSSCCSGIIGDYVESIAREAEKLVGCRVLALRSEGFAEEIYLVCSGGFMSIYAANNIARAVQRLAKRGDTGLAGIICNSNGNEAFENAVIPAFAKKLGTPLVQFVPRSPVIQACELEGRPVVEYAPDSLETEIFRNLAKAIMENDSRVIPTPVSDLAELEMMYRQHLVKI